MGGSTAENVPWFEYVVMAASEFEIPIYGFEFVGTLSFGILMLSSPMSKQLK